MSSHPNDLSPSDMDRISSSQAQFDLVQALKKLQLFNVLYLRYYSILKSNKIVY